jgi:hypothetical protein
MCFSLQTHVTVISSICLIYTVCYVTLFVSQMNGIVSGIRIFVMIWYAFSIPCQILSIVGSRKNNKWLLIPFIICLVLALLSYIVAGIYYGTQIWHAHHGLIPFIQMSIGFGTTIYILVIVVQLYKQIASRARLQTELVLQP